MAEEINFRQVPQNELDLNLMTTDSVWGKMEVPPELRARLEKLYIAVGRDPKGKITETVTKESLWGLLGFYTRDMRLANLSTFNGEVEYCQYYTDLAGDFLQTNLVEPFVICLQRVATVLELSQSKGGFLRRKMNTFTQENVKKGYDDEPPKKQLFGTKKPGGQY